MIYYAATDIFIIAKWQSVVDKSLGILYREMEMYIEIIIMQRAL